MIEKKYINKIMAEYLSILEKYEDPIKEFKQEDIKRFIGEVRLFWYRKRRYIRYFMANIEKKDAVAYLAGAMRVDIATGGHFDYVLVGKYRIVNEPIMKLSTFYKGTEKEINFEYTNQYLKDCVEDLLLILRKYSRDFWVLPIEPFIASNMEEYNSILIDAAERMVAAMFGIDDSELKSIIESECSYEEIESKLLPGMREKLIFVSWKDSQLSLRDKCKRYLEVNGDVMPVIKEFSESQIFYAIAHQYCMQGLAIANLMHNYKMIPFIRNDVTFQFFALIFYSNIMDDLSKHDYLQVYVPYVLQRTIDFSDKAYDELVDVAGNGKLVNYIIDYCEEQNINSLTAEDILHCVDRFYY